MTVKTSCQEKLPYHAPQVTVYGTMRGITKTDPSGGGPNDAMGAGFYLS